MRKTTDTGEEEVMEELHVRIPPGRLLIKQGRCPNGCSLINPNKDLSGKHAISAIVRTRGNVGMIHFNPFYGIYEYESDLTLQDGDIVELECPHCNVSLSVEDRCGMCNVSMFAIHLEDGGEVRACPTVGCHNHNLVIVDLDAQIADFYNEERRPKM